MHMKSIAALGFVAALLAFGAAPAKANVSNDATAAAESSFSLNDLTGCACGYVRYVRYHRVYRVYRVHRVYRVRYVYYY